MTAPKVTILGLGVKSTQYYIEELHKKYHERYQEYATFPHYVYQTDFNVKYINIASQLSDYQIEHFWDKKNGGFFFFRSMAWQKRK